MQDRPDAWIPARPDQPGSCLPPPRHRPRGGGAHHSDVDPRRLHLGISRLPADRRAGCLSDPRPGVLDAIRDTPATTRVWSAALALVALISLGFLGWISLRWLGLTVAWSRPLWLALGLLLLGAVPVFGMAAPIGVPYLLALDLLVGTRHHPFLRWMVFLIVLAVVPYVAAFQLNAFECL